ncbi:uncharacterized protein LOC129596998 [Paramacrobiotus metropolitanus]|uniref:uncharacterized protein LOC129596998 n=1 Tax=Paramacrobiotus metropolitanus TaxID=2943436 RepID=UPI002445F441|nr:uncharacterized protein LOC129596998 [Paramacrobiotus metropolitanus]
MTTQVVPMVPVPVPKTVPIYPRVLPLLGILQSVVGLCLVVCHSIAYGQGITAVMGLGFYLGVFLSFIGPIVYIVGKCMVTGDRTFVSIFLTKCAILSACVFLGALFILVLSKTADDFSHPSRDNNPCLPKQKDYDWVSLLSWSRTTTTTTTTTTTPDPLKSVECINFMRQSANLAAAINVFLVFGLIVGLCASIASIVYCCSITNR